MVIQVFCFLLRKMSLKINSMESIPFDEEIKYISKKIYGRTVCNSFDLKILSLLQGYLD